VLARKDTPTSYHLSVTVDDHGQGVTLVTRGEDILPRPMCTPCSACWATRRRFTPITACCWASTAKRLAERDKSTAIRSLRRAGGRLKMFSASPPK
jgi:glutamyl-Q tRNA(Asp) synthetase